MGSMDTQVFVILIFSPNKSCITTDFWSQIDFYCVNCTKFGQLILRKIIQIVVTRCHILRLKCTQFDFGWGSAYSALPVSLAGFERADF